MADAVQGPMMQAGILDIDESTDLIKVAYLILYWVTFAGVLVVPTYPEEPMIYFPAILAIAIAWLLAMVPVVQSLKSDDFEALTPPAGAWTVLVEAFQRRSVRVPTELVGDEATGLIGRYMTLVPSALPLVLIQIFYRLATKAVLVSIVGVIGTLMGPFLINIKIGGRWSPVSVLFAVSAPWVLALVGGLLLPFVLQLFLAGARNRDAIHQLERELPPTG